MTRLPALLAALFLLLFPAAALPQVGLTATADAEADAEATEATEAGGENLRLLLEVLEDEEARAALLDRLRAAAEEADPLTPGDAVEALAGEDEAPSEVLSFGRRIALITQEAAEEIAANLSRLGRQLSDAPDVFDGLSGDETGVLLDALGELALVILSTVAAFLLLRRVGVAIYARMGAAAREGGALRTVALYLASAVIDALIVVAAWAAGYALAILALGEFGSIGIRQTLYLNAFLLVEMAKVGVRLVLSPASADLRLLPVRDRAARYLSVRLNLIVGVVGYGMLLVVPIINANVSFAAGRAVTALIAFAVLSFAVWLVLRNRRPVAEWLLGPKRRRPLPPAPEAPLTAATPGEDRTSPAVAGAAPGPGIAPAPGAPGPGGNAPAVPPLEPAPDAAPEPGPELAPELAAEAEERRAEAAARHEVREGRGPVAFLARHWHWPALVYLLSLFVVVLVRPGDAVFRTFLNSGQVFLVALAGLTVSGLLSRTMRRGVQLPERVTERLPLLEHRLNRFVPRALFVLRLVIFALVVLVALDAINLIDLRGWMVSQFGLQLTGTLVSVALVLLGAFAVWIALTSWVDYRLNPQFGHVATAREQTLLTLLRNAATIALLIITLMFVLAEIGLDIGPLLASAGVLGLAIGFGAQKMVQDIITGVFIQLENAMNVGDVVTVGGTTGTVERLTIRSASLRDLTGAYHIIPFSSVDMVTNYVKDFGYFLCDMGVAYREDLDEVKQAMMEAFDELRADPEHRGAILDALEWFGLQSFGDSAVVLRARIKCVPGKQWGVGRAYNAILKRVFDARNIEIPFPHQTIYLGESKDGQTQSVKVRLEEGAAAS
jgi:small-conductance mechanosensitive channel